MLGGAGGISGPSRDPGETLKCCTLVGEKRVADAERQPVAAAGAAKRQRTQLLLPPAAVTVLGESATAYHKLVEFDRRVDVTLKHYRHALEARLRTAGVGPNGEMVSTYPVAPFHPVTRVLRLHVDFQHESALDPQLPASTRWMLRLWGVYADRPDVEVDLSRHLQGARPHPHPHPHPHPYPHPHPHPHPYPYPYPYPRLTYALALALTLALGELG